jgi:hypothetical protein
MPLYKLKVKYISVLREACGFEYPNPPYKDIDARGRVPFKSIYKQIFDLQNFLSFTNVLFSELIKKKLEPTDKLASLKSSSHFQTRLRP